MTVGYRLAFVRWEVDERIVGRKGGENSFCVMPFSIHHNMKKNDNAHPDRTQSTQTLMIKRGENKGKAPPLSVSPLKTGQGTSRQCLIFPGASKHNRGKTETVWSSSSIPGHIMATATIECYTPKNSTTLAIHKFGWRNDSKNSQIQTIAWRKLDFRLKLRKLYEFRSVHST